MQELDVTATDLSTDCLIDLLTRIPSLRWLSAGQLDGFTDPVRDGRARLLPSVGSFIPSFLYFFSSTTVTFLSAPLVFFLPVFFSFSSSPIRFQLVHSFSFRYTFLSLSLSFISLHFPSFHLLFPFFFVLLLSLLLFPSFDRFCPSPLSSVPLRSFHFSSFPLLIGFVLLLFLSFRFASFFLFLPFPLLIGSVPLPFLSFRSVLLFSLLFPVQQTVRGSREPLRVELGSSVIHTYSQGYSGIVMQYSAIVTCSS